MKWFKELIDKYKSRRKLKYGDLQIELAQALMWRDEEVSGAAIPSHILKQPEEFKNRMLEDSKYLLDWIDRWYKKQEKENKHD